MFSSSKTGKQPSSGSSNDPQFNYVSLLLNGDGTNGGQNNTFLDSSSNAFTVTRNGTPTQGSFIPFGDLWSIYLNGSSSQWISQTSGSIGNFGTGDFTVEFWLNPSSVAQQNLIDFRGTGGTGSCLRIFIQAISKSIDIGLSADEQIVSSSQLVVGTWRHVALTRSSGTVRLFENGVLTGSTTNTTSLSDSGLIIGSYKGTTAYYTGFISNLRVVKGTALYTSAFTPSTTPLTAVSSTSLLACQSNRFIDNSTNNFALTVNGSPSIQRFSPFEPSASYSASTNGGSGFFNGSTDYLSVASNTALELGSSNFTIECWIYCASVTNYLGVVSRHSTTTGARWVLSFENSNIKFWASAISGGPVCSSTGTIKLNEWNHIAVVRSGTSITIYLNGVGGTPATSSATIATATDSVFIGNDPVTTGRFFSGYISNVRIVKGTAVYTSNFTPATAPLTAVTNTSLLVKTENASIPNLSTITNLTTVGNAQVSSTQVKYGTGSMKFDGTGDYLTFIDNPSLQLFNGDFTIEGWIYLTANGVAYGIISKGTSTTGWSVNITSGNKLQFSYTASNLTGATSLSATTWYHFAVVRSGTASGNLKVYLNGTADATSAGAVTDTFNQTNIMYVGADRVATSQLNGYIDDLRITRGLARYTTTFTPPTAALPTY